MKQKKEISWVKLTIQYNELNGIQTYEVAYFPFTDNKYDGVYVDNLSIEKNLKQTHYNSPLQKSL